MIRQLYSRPWKRGQALQHVICKVLCGEVAVLEQRARLDFDITNGSKLFYERAERVKGADRLHPDEISHIQ